MKNFNIFVTFLYLFTSLYTGLNFGCLKMEFDESLINRMKKGQQQAFSQCYEQVSPLVYSIIFRVCNCKTSAQDILQESFIQAFSSLNKLENSDRFVVWLKRIAFNKTISWIRKNNKHVVNCVEEDAHNTLEAASTNDIARHLEQQNTLAKLLSKLTPQARLIVWLFVVEGYSHQEIASMHNKSVSYSKSTVARALALLKTRSEVKSHAKQ